MESQFQFLGGFYLPRLNGAFGNQKYPGVMILVWAKQIVKALAEDGSPLNKAVKGVKRGVGIAQDIAEGCNEVLQWLGMS